MNRLFKTSFPITSDFKGHLLRIPPSRAPGIDIAAKAGTVFHAPATGRVLDVRWTKAGGLSVWIAHGGRVQTYYAHLACVFVGRGQRVALGERIGKVGSSGNATGPHLHFSVRRDGMWVNPAPILEPVDELQAISDPIEELKISSDNGSKGAR